jgi:hypothetical protein
VEATASLREPADWLDATNDLPGREQMTYVLEGPPGTRRVYRVKVRLRESPAP